MCRSCQQESLRALVALNAENGHVSEQKPKRQYHPKHIPPIIDNFKRTKKGGVLINQELRRLLNEQMRMFPKRSMLTMDSDKVRFAISGENKSISRTELELKAPIFFSAFFVGIRRKLDYGARVQKWLSETMRAMVDNGSTKELNQLIGQIATFHPTELQGLSEESD